jgi:hypothetical protein
LTATGLTPRESAVVAADQTCPRCGSLRAADQRYCLDCGLPLPRVEGTLPSLRRRWIRRLGWYPGDWVWMSLLTLVVAAAGGAAAIVVSERRQPAGPPVFEASPTAVSVAEPKPLPVTAGGRPVRRRGTLPKPPEQARAVPNGRLRWPARGNGWTIVLISYPKTTGRVQALDRASHAARAGLQQVGILDSSRFASLQPGYFVVFTGIYGSKQAADAAVATARAAGFGGAYSRQIAR